MTLLTAMIIQTRGDDVVCAAGGPSKEGKYSGLVELHSNGDYDHLLLSSEPEYESALAAVNAMENVVRQVREAKL